VIAWCIAKRYRATSAAEMMSGDGALRVGGRWNSKDIRAVYAASSLSLAALEVLVHVSNPRVLHDYVMLRLQVPDNLIVDYRWSAVDAEAMKARVIAFSRAWKNSRVARSVYRDSGRANARHQPAASGIRALEMGQATALRLRSTAGMNTAVGDGQQLCRGSKRGKQLV
jgi:RES domain-containing protein